MTPYAENTTVPIGRSRDEIERTLERFGADGQAFMRDDTRRFVAIAFHRENRNYRFTLKLPDPEMFRYGKPRSKYGAKPLRTEIQLAAVAEQETRRRFRSLANFIKATLAAVQDEIITADEALLPYLILPSGNTVYETSVMQLADMGDVNFRKALGAGE